MKDKLKILVVDDEKNIRVSLCDFLRGHGYDADYAASADEALDMFARKRIDLVITDYKMPGKDGYALSKALLEKNPGLIVIIMTAYGSIEDAVHTIKYGIYDYLTKPLNTDELLRKIGLVERDVFSTKVAAVEGRKHFLFDLRSAVSQHILSSVKKASSTHATVLITGETGTGKTEVARAIHAMSDRKDGPFVYINCAAISPNLMESELFGHVKGAFTGADKARPGKILQADGGTLFLDEIGSTSVNFQSKLLGVLQDKCFEHVGDDKSIKVDVRFIAATNVNLEEAMKNKEFRQDLYFRLKVVSISLPPLRDRSEDVPELARHFAKESAPKREVTFTQGAIEKMLDYDWPGNIRELKNVVITAIESAENGTIEVDHLLIDTQGESEDIESTDGALKEAVSFAEKDTILAALEKSRGNMTEAAALLKIHERSLRRKLKLYDIDRKVFNRKDKS